MNEAGAKVEPGWRERQDVWSVGLTRARDAVGTWPLLMALRWNPRPRVESSQRVSWKLRPAASEQELRTVENPDFHVPLHCPHLNRCRCFIPNLGSEKHLCSFPTPCFSLFSEEDGTECLLGDLRLPVSLLFFVRILRGIIIPTVEEKTEVQRSPFWGKGTGD